jgi:excisionase family DNA binding protein
MTEHHGNDADAWLTVAEAAEAKNVTTRTVHRWIKSDILPAQRIGVGRGNIRINPTDLAVVDAPRPYKQAS